jgi:DsbC/DsbD-like thiol-disulfide interchange protein
MKTKGSLYSVLTGVIMMVVLFGVTAKAQIVKPASWNFMAKKVKADLYELHMTATINEGWATYSQWTPEGGPEPTVISFDKNTNFLFGGKAKEVGIVKKKHEDVFDVDVHYFEHQVDFVQLVKLKNVKGDRKIKGKINYMVCDKSQCITDEVGFSVELK